MINSGARWRDGNGESIKVLTNILIPNCSGFKVVGAASGKGLDTKVCDLIDQDLGSWKRETNYCCL